MRPTDGTDLLGWVGWDHLGLAQGLATIYLDRKQHGGWPAERLVPFLASYRYKPSGLRKRAAWEHTWDLQRHEDAGEKVEIEVPPKYNSGDFARHSY